MAGVDDYDYGGLYERASRLFGGARDWWKSVRPPEVDPQSSLPRLPAVLRRNQDTNLPVEDPTSLKLPAPLEVAEQIGRKSVAPIKKAAKVVGGEIAGGFGAASESQARMAGAMYDVSDPRNTGSEHKPLSDVAWEGVKGLKSGYDKGFGASDIVDTLEARTGKKIEDPVASLAMHGALDVTNLIGGGGAKAVAGAAPEISKAWLPMNLFKKAKNIEGFTHGTSPGHTAEMLSKGFGLTDSSDILGRWGHAGPYSPNEAAAARAAGKAPHSKISEQFTGYGASAEYSPIDLPDDAKIMDVTMPVPLEDVDAVINTMHPVHDKNKIDKIMKAYHKQAQYVVPHNLVREGKMTPQQFAIEQQAKMTPTAVARVNELQAQLASGTSTVGKYNASGLSSGNAPLNSPSIGALDRAAVYYHDTLSSGNSYTKQQEALAFNPSETLMAPAGSTKNPATTPWQKIKSTGKYDPTRRSFPYDAPPGAPGYVAPATGSTQATPSPQVAAQHWAAQNTPAPTPPVPAPIQYPPNTPLPVQDTAGPMYKGKPISTYEQGTIKELKAAGRTLNRQQAAKFEEMQNYEGNYKAINEVTKFEASNPTGQKFKKLSPEGKELYKQHFPENYYALSGETYTPPPSTVSTPQHSPAAAKPVWQQIADFQQKMHQSAVGYAYGDPEVASAMKPHWDAMSPEAQASYSQSNKTLTDLWGFNKPQASGAITDAHTQAGQAFGKNVMGSSSGFTSIEIAEKFQKLPIETQAAVKIAEPDLYDWLVGSYGWKNTGAPKPDLDHLINPSAAPGPVQANLPEPRTMKQHWQDVQSIFEEYDIPPSYGNSLAEMFNWEMNKPGIMTPEDIHTQWAQAAMDAGHPEAAEDIIQLWDTKLKADTLDVPPETPPAFSDSIWTPEEQAGKFDVFHQQTGAHYGTFDSPDEADAFMAAHPQGQMLDSAPANPTPEPPGFDALDFENQGGIDALNQDMSQIGKLDPGVPTLEQHMSQIGKLPPALSKVAPPSALSPLGKASLENLDAEGTLDYLKNTYANIAENFGKHSGTEMGSIEEHTKDVLKQWKTQLTSQELANLSARSGIDVEALMNVALPLHDIGKPAAIAAGDKTMQHSHTIPLMTEVLKKEGFDQKDIALATELFNHDAIGSLLQGTSNYIPQEVAGELAAKAAKIGMNPSDFAKLQLAFFQADASSYPFIRQYMNQMPNGGWVSDSSKLKPIKDLIVGK